MKILFVASEARPFIASGGLADVAGSLPKALCDLGHECRVVIPLYKNIPQQFREKNGVCKKLQCTAGMA